MILKGESAEEFIRKADENYEKYKARQKQNLIDMMEADEKLGLYQKPTKLYTIKNNKSLSAIWQAFILIIKVLYLILGSIIIIPIAITIVLTNYIYKHAKTYIQTKIRR